MTFWICKDRGLWTAPNLRFFHISNSTFVLAVLQKSKVVLRWAYTDKNNSIWFVNEDHVVVNNSFESEFISSGRSSDLVQSLAQFEGLNSDDWKFVELRSPLHPVAFVLFCPPNKWIKSHNVNFYIDTLARPSPMYSLEEAKPDLTVTWPAVKVLVYARKSVDITIQPQTRSGIP